MKNVSETKENLLAPLEELGLSTQEVDLYTLSLAMGPASINELAKTLHIARPNMYKVIRSLEKHGLANFSEKKKYSRNFLVASPAIVLEKLREKKERADAIDRSLSIAMPNLLSLFQQGDMPAKVKVIQGKEGFLKIFWMILDEAQGEMRFMGSVKDFIGFISWNEEREWIRERLKRNILMKCLVFASEDAGTLKKRDQEELRETRILEGIIPFTTSFQIFANKIVFWQPKASLAILIEDEYLVAMLKNIFDHLWEKRSK